MKAIIYTQYGPPQVLHLGEVEKPVPQEHDVLVRVRATSVTFGDRMARDFKAVSPGKFNMLFIFWLMAKLSFGLQRPRNSILGSEFSGEVAAVGKAVSRFKPGDSVFGYPGANMGAYAEYLCMPESGMLAIKPANLRHEQAAVLPYGASTALNLLGRVNIQPGQKVLILGASGGIGSAALQLARHYGAEVTGVCSTARLDLVRALGARHVIDYTRQDFTHSGETYDLIFDVLGKTSFGACRSSLTPNGQYLRASFKGRHLLQALWTSLAGGRRAICALAPGRPADLDTVRELAEAGVLKVIVDRVFPMEQAAEAHRYVEQGQNKGPVAITLGQASEGQ